MRWLSETLPSQPAQQRSTKDEKGRLASKSQQQPAANGSSKDTGGIFLENTSYSQMVLAGL